MSVIAYTNTEIVSALVATWDRGSAGSTDGLRHIQHLADLGTMILEANAAAYAKTYEGEDLNIQPITSFDIKSGLHTKTVETNRRGRQCLEGLRYNLIANDGTDFATIEILDGLLRMTMALLRASDRRAA